MDNLKFDKKLRIGKLHCFSNYQMYVITKKYFFWGGNLFFTKKTLMCLAREIKRVMGVVNCEIVWPARTSWRRWRRRQTVDSTEAGRRSGSDVECSSSSSCSSPASSGALRGRGSSAHGLAPVAAPRAPCSPLRALRPTAASICFVDFGTKF